MKCDSHIHIYDRAFLARDDVAGFVDGADVDAYRKVQARMGTQRVVIVTPRIYGTDNAVTVDAVRQIGIENARGIAVLHPEVTDAELDALDKGGIRGIRFTLYTATNAAVGFEMVKPLAHRVAELGWHVQLHWTAQQLVEHRAMLQRLHCRMVFDHRARLPLQKGVNHEAFSIASCRRPAAARLSASDRRAHWCRRYRPDCVDAVPAHRVFRRECRDL